VAELDGLWTVRRTGGALPPLVGVRKRISGARGETIVANGVRLAFDVRGNELHYRAPLTMLVDVLTPDADGFRGRSKLFGRDLGTFELRRIDVDDQVTAQLVKHIDEAHAMEQNVLRMLDGMIQTTDDPEMLDRLEHHKVETQTHANRMRERLEAHGASPSMVKQAGGILQALAKMPLDMVRTDKAGRNARDGFTTEHLEIASYELLRRVAQRAGDEETAQAATEIIEEEQAMATFIAERWDQIVDQSLREAGVPVEATTPKAGG
jgi:ferritin-like metal-binding protein YciE